MPPSDIFLVRHAESAWNATGRWQGQADPPLSPRGLDQARYLAENFPDVDVTDVLSSDLERALKTAKPFAARFDTPVQIDLDLREIDVGTWSGKTREEIAEQDPESLERYFRGETGWEGGETFEEHEERAMRVARRLEAVETNGVVVAVTHGGTIRAILRTLLELPHEERWRLSGPGHTSLTHVTRGKHGWRLVTFNGVADIRRT